MKSENWQPISTCPPGRVRVLLWFPKLGYAVSGWLDAYGETWKKQATHWQPSPEGPDVP